jgi:hypothetical protein
MPGMIFLLISGVLLIIFGAMLFINDTSTFKEFEDYSTSALRNFIMIISLFLAVAGLMAILTGIFKYTIILRFSSYIGMKLVTFSLLIFTGAVFSTQSGFMPFFETLGSAIGFSPDRTILLSWICVLALAVIIQVYQTGIRVTRNWEWNAFIIVESVSRALIIFTILFIVIRFGFIEHIPQNISAFALAVLIGMYIPIFVTLRKKADNSIVKLIFLTLLCIILLPVYSVIVTFLYSYVGFILEWTSIIPLAGLLVLMFFIGSAEVRDTKKIGICLCEMCGDELVGWYQYCSTECTNKAEASKRPAMNRISQGSSKGGNFQCKACGQMVEGTVNGMCLACLTKG